MNNEGSNSEFFAAGGTLLPDSPSYVKRAADDELLSLTQAGKYAYVLTASQMGKSSLMIRTSTQLHRQGIKTAIIDLTQIGIQETTIKEWVLSLLDQLQRNLQLTEELGQWWVARQDKAAVYLFTSFLREVLLTEISEPIVIFIDEIGRTLDFEYRDDFFAAIRAMYNARATDLEYNRLTFVLLGIASPSELIKDPIHTPFGIATPIALEDFSQKQALIFQEHLEKVFPDKGEIIFKHIYDWTNGHPYLTQKLCRSLVDEPNRHWEEEKIINSWITELFKNNRPQQDENLKWVEQSILKHAKQDDLLSLYKRVYQGEKVRDDPQSIIHNQLKLSGLVKVKDEHLHLRNEIYKLFFDLKWIERNSQITKEPSMTGSLSSLEPLPSLVNSMSRFKWTLLAPTILAICLLYFMAYNPVPYLIPIEQSPTPTTPFVPVSTPTLSRTQTGTPTATASQTATPAATASQTATPAATASQTATSAATASQTAIPTVTQTAEPITETPTQTAIRTLTPQTTERGHGSPTNTPVPPTVALNTPVSPTVAPNTPVPPTVAPNTPVPPTVVPPTNTRVPPTVVPPTNTRVPPTVAPPTNTVVQATVELPTNTVVPPTVELPTNTVVQATVESPTNTPVVPTVTPPDTPSPVIVPTATSIQRVAYAQPQLLTPENGSAFSQPTLLQWSWQGTLQEDEYFDVRVWREGNPAWGIDWTKDTSFLFNPSTYGGGTYFWTIVVIRGQDGNMLEELSGAVSTRSFTISREPLSSTETNCQNDCPPRPTPPPR